MPSNRGHVQRTIIGALTHNPYMSTPDLVNEVFNLHGPRKDIYSPRQPPAPPTQAQLKSVWRALRRLREQGIIEESERVNRKGYHLWVISRKPVTHQAFNAKLRAQKPRLVGI